MALLVALWAPAPAHAVHYRVQAETVGDAYQLVTSSNLLLNRRRLHQYLGLQASDLLSDGEYALNAAVLFRFDADFGITDQNLEDVYHLRRQQLSLQYAWVDGRGVAGFIDFRLGRQVHYDALDYLMLDGVVLTFATPWYFGVELQAGLEVKDGMAGLNQSAFELDGVRIIEDGEANDRPTVVVGAALVSRDLTYTRARLGYRRLFSGGEVDAEKVGGSFYQRLVEGLHLSTLASYDLYNGRFDRLQAGLRWQATPFLDVEGEYVRLLPSFDADSIFNIFTAFPLNDGNLRLRLHPSDEDRLYVGGMVRFFGNEGYTDGLLLDDVDTVVQAYGAMAGYFRRFAPDTTLHVDLSWESGYGGERMMGDVGASYTLVPREWVLDGRLTAVSFADGLQDNLDGFSFGYQLGARYLIERKAAVSLLVEHNFSRLQSSNLRVYAVVDLDFWL
ncbi:MAG: hypothetical protein EP329_14155 [Deltaproteobacteria bacterium]|nr:MAG: hypothetical protein EP329_14155 [Deltaproteobacteria bacterium]